jgi:ornithine cyclodeaminase/alanine dehydrogenase-like protein (mu-crystallin family)
MLEAMPAYLQSSGVVAAKLVTLFPNNAGLGLDTHQAAILAFDHATGSSDSQPRAPFTFRSTVNTRRPTASD